MKKPDQKSIVAERLAMFAGKTIAVRVSWDPHADVIGRYIDVRPIGRPYFIVLVTDGRERLINVEAVLELGEVAP